MLIIGLTGSIGMGKSTAAARFRALGIPVSDADAIVHALYEGEAAPLVEEAFPGAVSEGRVDRAKLSTALAARPQGLARLEALVHPLVHFRQRAFLFAAHAAGAEFAVLEVPLLFERGSDPNVDVTVVVSASEEVQRRRVLERPGMTEKKLALLLARQMGDAEKRRRADFVVDTSGPVSECEAQIDSLVETLRGRRGSAYHRFWA